MRQSASLRQSRSGFTTVELLVALVAGVVVLAAIYELMVGQIRLYTVHREAMDARETLRSAAALLSWELTEVAATGGDFYAIGTNSVSLRSVQASGVVCARKLVGSKDRFGLQLVSGVFGETADDSALVYLPSSDSWNVLKIAKVWNGSGAQSTGPSGGGTPFCFWGDTSAAYPRAQATVELEGDSAAIADLAVGSLLKNFRRTEYALFQQNGRWWLGRRVGAASGYEILTGPMRAPADSGVVFGYYDAAGAPTSDPSRVVEVEIVLHSESSGTPSGRYKALADSLRTRVFLRNNSSSP